MEEHAKARRLTTMQELISIGRDDRIALAGTQIGAGLTYGELRAFVRDVHIFLANEGVTPDSVVAYSLRNGPETAALFLALISYCRVAPINPGYTASEVAFVLRDVQACALIAAHAGSTAASATLDAGAGLLRLRPEGPDAHGRFALQVESPVKRFATPAMECGPADVALLLHTSGTTAQPKLVPLTQRNLCGSALAVASVLKLTPEDRCLSIMPLFHIHGLVAGLLASIASGATVCCAPGFDALRFFSWLDQSGATWYTAVPAMHQAIVSRAKHNAGTIGRHRLRLIRSSSSPLHPALAGQLTATFNVPVLNAYGMTEAAHQIASVPLTGGPARSGTVGFSTGPEVAILGPDGPTTAREQRGEILLRGEQIMSGYAKPAGANDAAFIDGWFRTGDEGFLDAEGAISLTGRLKEMINSGGEKISPYEVEDVLMQHPAVAEAVAFAAPHARLGEQVAAAIVLHQGAEATERQVLSAASGRLARCKVPRRLLIVSEIPRGATGKVQRKGMAGRLGLDLLDTSE
jgi:oxalate---CoA ligase